MKKIKKVIGYVVYLILFFIFIYNKLGDSTDIRVRIILSLLFTIIMNVLMFLTFFPIIYVIKKANKSIKKEKLSKEDIIKNKKIYREILNNISPAVLSYVDNMEIDYEKEIISSLLCLKQKEYIEMDNDGIIKLNKKDTMELGKIETYIFNSIENGKVNIDKNIIKDYVIEDAIKQRVVYVDNNISSRSQKKLKKLAINYLYIIIGFIVSLQLDITSLISFFLFFVSMYPLGAAIYLGIYKDKSVKNPIFRTEKGIEVNKKLEGLKNYIREYSLLDDKTSDAIEVWEDYLIYSVIFGQNQLVIKEYLPYIKLK